MQSDDDLQTTLSKWPFILGDVFLVATALAIAILGQWQLTNWQVASCVLSVALGAALFVLPYVVEYQVRVREEAEDRSADLRSLQRHLLGTQDQLEALSDRIETLESGLTGLAQATPDLSGPLEALEKQIEPIRQSSETQSAELAKLAKLAAALDAQVRALETSLGAKPEADAIEALQSDLAALQAKVNEWPAPTAEKEEAPEDESPSEPVTKKTRKRRTAEPRLLQRAIDQKRDHSSAAVSRIIETRTKSVDEPEESTAEALAVEAVPEPEPTAASEPVLASEVEPEATLADDVELVDASTLAEEPEPEPEEEPEPETAESEASESEVGETEDMFADVVPPQVNKRARTKKSDTAVIASVFIGIGNKPYVRGSGAGLSWDQGIAMEFEEIGKWRWIAPADLDAPVELQLFRNDEDPDTTGKYTLEPGQQLDLSPVF